MTELKPITILLVEDNVDHAELMMDTLKDFNIHNAVVHVGNGEAALAYLNRQAPYDQGSHVRPNLILLDIKMPRMNGIETLKHIKSDEQLSYIPGVMVSTSSTATEIHQCFELGASSYVTKPLQFEEFTRKIKALNLYWVLTSELPANR